MLLMSGFPLLLGGAVFLGKLHVAFPVLVLLVSLITFCAYALDKRAARRGAWRTSESTLHLLALFGGWPGALLAQRWVRHKTRKVAFLRVFWITVVLNVCLIFAAMTESGQQWLAEWVSLI